MKNFKQFLQENLINIVSAVFFVLGLGLIYKFSVSKAKTEVNSAIAVKVQPIIIQPIQKQVKFEGKIRSRESVVLQSDIVGTIQEMKPDGAFVSKEEVIIVLVHQEAEAKFLMTKARCNDEKRKLDNLEKLFGENYVSKEHFEEQKARYEEASAKMKEAEAFLNKHFIKAPFDGVLGLQLQGMGSCVNQHTKLVSITNPNNMEAEFVISETELAQIGGINEIKKANIFIFFETQKITANAKFSAAENTIDTQINGTAVRIKIEAPDEISLAPGQNCRVILSYGEAKNKTVVPTKAVLSMQGFKYIFIVKDNIAVQIPIEAGQESSSFTEILSNEVKEGDLVIVEDLYRIFDGQEVNAHQE